MENKTHNCADGKLSEKELKEVERDYAHLLMENEKLDYIIACTFSPASYLLTNFTLRRFEIMYKSCLFLTIENKMDKLKECKELFDKMCEEMKRVLDVQIKLISDHTKNSNTH